jgi:hypothetical protein
MARRMNESNWMHGSIEEKNANERDIGSQIVRTIQVQLIKASAIR